MYGNEAEIGEALQGCGVPRAERFLSSKIRPTRIDALDNGGHSGDDSRTFTGIRPDNPQRREP